MITRSLFGTVYGKPVYKYTLMNSSGTAASILTYGAVIQSLVVPARSNRMIDVVCGYDDLTSYIEGDGYQGAVVGRFANRIGNAEFALNGVKYKLFKNDNENSLHGGERGLNQKLFAATVKEKENSIVLATVMEDMEEGYPGRLTLEVKYTLTEANELVINYRASSDKDTVINLTNHSYFNLSGYASGTVLDHTLAMDADTFLPTDDSLIPTGELRSVEGTPFDFRKEKALGHDFFEDYAPLKQAGGYDHCMNFTGGETENPVCRATLKSYSSGVAMRMLTNQPCVQLYTANFMKNPDYPFKGGFPQHAQNAVCLETQHMPDSINQAGFTNVILRAGDEYNYTTIYAFELI